MTARSVTAVVAADPFRILLLDALVRVAHVVFAPTVLFVIETSNAISLLPGTGTGVGRIGSTKAVTTGAGLNVKRDGVVSVGCPVFCRREEVIKHFFFFI